VPALFTNITALNNQMRWVNPLKAFLYKSMVRESMNDAKIN
jgi:hypothetical protein